MKAPIFYNLGVAPQLLPVDTGQPGRRGTSHRYHLLLWSVSTDRKAELKKIILECNFYTDGKARLRQRLEQDSGCSRNFRGPHMLKALATSRSTGSLRKACTNSQTPSKQPSFSETVGRPQAVDLALFLPPWCM